MTTGYRIAILKNGGLSMTDEVPKRQSALDTPDAKIWRYLDLQKLVSMLSTRALFFARPSAFRDPYEGWMPRTHIDALAGINQTYIAQQHDLKRPERPGHNPISSYQELHRASVCTWKTLEFSFGNPEAWINAPMNSHQSLSRGLKTRHG